MSEKHPVDDTPLLVRHGRTIWRDVVETKSTAEVILGILAPDGEESPSSMGWPGSRRSSTPSC